jgi:hypothetical protein
MKQILLGITGVGAEMGLTETAQPGKPGPPPGKIKPPQSPHDPDIQWEGLRESMREEQNAIGDFGAHPGQFEQSGARFRHRQRGEPG